MFCSESRGSTVVLLQEKRKKFIVVQMHRMKDIEERSLHCTLGVKMKLRGRTRSLGYLIVWSRKIWGGGGAY